MMELGDFFFFFWYKELGELESSKMILENTDCLSKNLAKTWLGPNLDPFTQCITVHAK